MLHIGFTMPSPDDKLTLTRMDYMGYYTLLIYIGIFALMIMQLFVYKSNTLTHARKRMFHCIYAVIAIAAFFEWIGHVLDTGTSAHFVLIASKVTEHILTPIIPFLFSRIIIRRPAKYIYVLFTANIVFQLVSAFNGFMFYIDADGFYRHTQFYWIYLIICIISIIYMLITVLRNIGRYQYSGSALFLLIIIWMVIGISIQMAFNRYRIGYAVIVTSSIMTYVFVLEMIQQTDELTELLNRHSYENYIAHIESHSIVLFFDADNYKYINDTYGHAYGDTVLKRIGLSIKQAYAPYGTCFRYGGDEFCVILTKELDKVDEINSTFFQSVDKIREVDPQFPWISVGYAFYEPGVNDIRDTIAEADKMMYKYKHINKSDSSENPVKSE